MIRISKSADVTRIYQRSIFVNSLFSKLRTSPHLIRYLYWKYPYIFWTVTSEFPIKMKISSNFWENLYFSMNNRPGWKKKDCLMWRLVSQNVVRFASLLEFYPWSVFIQMKQKECMFIEKWLLSSIQDHNCYAGRKNGERSSEQFCKNDLNIIVKHYSKIVDYLDVTLSL